MAKVGRPSKGDRRVLYTRAPIPVADEVRAEATRRGLTLADVVAEILCDRYGHTYAPTQANRKQEALELNTA
jgi:hypothetical protein